MEQITGSVGHLPCVFGIYSTAKGRRLHRNCIRNLSNRQGTRNSQNLFPSRDASSTHVENDPEEKVSKGKAQINRLSGGPGLRGLTICDGNRFALNEGIEWCVAGARRNRRGRVLALGSCVSDLAERGAGFEIRARK